jgi:hypothetical protein
MSLVKTTRPKRYFYANNVNMNWSFDRLAHLAETLLGAELDVGDIIICDNHNKTKRKMLQKTKRGFMIYYGRLHKELFVALADNNGQIKNIPEAGVL